MTTLHNAPAGGKRHRAARAIGWVFALSIALTLVAMVVYDTGHTVPLPTAVRSTVIYYDAPEITEPIRAPDPYTTALEKGFLKDAASQGIMNYLRVHSAVPDYIILSYYKYRRQKSD